MGWLPPLPGPLLQRRSVRGAVVVSRCARRQAAKGCYAHAYGVTATPGYQDLAWLQERSTSAP